jgi:sec-independent protein translocase protein TatC
LLDQTTDIEEGQEMSFLDHLEELRWHLVRSAAAIIIFSIVAFLAKDYVWGTLILGPTKGDFWTYRMMCMFGQLIGSDMICMGDLPIDMQNREMTGQFMMHITSSLVIGIILAFPYTFWEIWRFVSPGLHKQEKGASRGAVIAVSFLFMSGVFFGYFIVTPVSFQFLATYTLDASIQNNIDIISLVKTLSMLVLACAFMFQLPVVTYFLSKAGLVTPELMRRYRKHGIVAILILSAVITPPDVYSQILISLPLVFLYEISIKISRRVQRKKEKESNEDN